MSHFNTSAGRSLLLLMSLLVISFESPNAFARSRWRRVTPPTTTPTVPVPTTPTPTVPTDPAPTVPTPPSTTNCTINVAPSGAQYSSISSAISAASSGAVICVAPGIYSAVTVSKSIQLVGSPGAIIDAGSPNKTPVIVAANNVTIQGFELRNGYDGISSWNYGNIKVLNNRIHGNQRFGIILSASSRAANSGHLISGNTVYNNVLHNQARTMSGNWASAIRVDVTNGATVSNNCSFENYGEGIGILLSTNVKVESNTVYDNYSVQIYLDNVARSSATGNLAFSTGNLEFYKNGRSGDGTLLANEFYSGYGDPSYIATDSMNVTGNTYSGVTLPRYDGSYGVGGGITNSQLNPNTSVSGYSVSWLCSK